MSTRNTKIGKKTHRQKAAINLTPVSLILAWSDDQRGLIGLVNFQRCLKTAQLTKLPSTLSETEWLLWGGCHFELGQARPHADGGASTSTVPMLDCVVGAGLPLALK